MASPSPGCCTIGMGNAIGMAEKVDDDPLICSICLDSYKRPKLLPCFHTFCQACLERLGDEEETRTHGFDAATTSIEVLRTGYFPDISVWPAAMFEGSNVQWRLRKSAFRIAVQLRRQLYSKLFAYYKRTNTCVKIC